VHFLVVAIAPRSLPIHVLHLHTYHIDVARTHNGGDGLGMQQHLSQPSPFDIVRTPCLLAMT